MSYVHKRADIKLLSFVYFVFYIIYQMIFFALTIILMRISVFANLSTTNDTRVLSRKIFFDIGTNDGASLVDFTLSQLNDSRIHIRDFAKTHMLQYNYKIISEDRIARLKNSILAANDSLRVGYDSWELYGFEPNNRFKKPLDTVRNFLEGLNGIKSCQILCETAIGVNDGTANLILDRGEGDGSTLSDESKVAVGKSVPVTVIDIVTLFKEYRIRERDFVVLKIDIEGMEYEVVKRILLHNIMPMVDKIAVEWYKSFLLLSLLLY